MIIKTNTMFIKETFYGLKCDNCCKVYEGEEYSFFPDKDSVEDAAGNDDCWHKGSAPYDGVDGEHYCDECWYYTENDTFLLHRDRKDKYKDHPKTSFDESN